MSLDTIAVIVQREIANYAEACRQSGTPFSQADAEKWIEKDFHANPQKYQRAIVLSEVVKIAEQKAAAGEITYDPKTGILRKVVKDDPTGASA